jgi:hypothetical protein
LFRARRSLLEEPPVREIDLSRCKHAAPRSTHGCKAPATTLVRYLNKQGRCIRQFEFCDEHLTKTLAAAGAKVHDRRRAVSYF